MPTNVTGAEDEGVVSNYRFEQTTHHIDQRLVIMGVRWCSNPRRNLRFHQTHLLALDQWLY